MHKRLYAQRQHLIQSLDILLYELHVLAFFLSPSIWTLLFRVLSQSQCSKPREVDAAWSLRAFFALLICLNSLTVWTHATSGPSEGKTVILDFIGLASAPSKFRLLFLDFLIVFLQMVLAAIAYETSLAKDTDDSGDPPLSAPSPSPDTVPDRTTKPYPPRSSPPYVLDLRFGTVITRLRNPLPPAGSTNSVDGLPLPNTTPTTPWPLPAVGLRILLGVPSGRPGREANEPGEGNARIPGALPDVA